MEHEADPFAALDEAQLGRGDMDPARFRAAGHAVVDAMADYLAGVEARAVLPAIEPGSIRPLLPESAPEDPEPLATILADVDRLVVPNATHWQHPGFLAYFATTASSAGILGEMWTAVLGQNPMLWRTSPIGTELEQVVVGWLRRALGLPAAFDGLLTDTASTSTLLALAAAREAAGLRAAAEGLAARVVQGRAGVYKSTVGQSSIENDTKTLGLGRAALQRLSVDDAYRMRPDLLAEAIAADRAAGGIPVAIVATIGTTSSTSVDPIAPIAEIAALEGIWLHVDAAYAGAVAIVPPRRGPFEGWERADSIVVNPHKWLFTPLDASLFLSRRMDGVRAAFSLVPEYLRTLDQERPVHDFTEYQPQLGRRMRALKLWMQLRYFGLAGMRRRIDAHCRLAEELAAPWTPSRTSSGWRRCRSPRLPPLASAALAGREDEPAVRVRLDAANERLMAAVNATGEVFLSHTRLHDRFAIRVAIGNLRTEGRHVDRAWELLVARRGRWRPEPGGRARLDRRRSPRLRTQRPAGRPGGFHRWSPRPSATSRCSSTAAPRRPPGRLDRGPQPGHAGPVGRVPAGTEADVDRAVRAARIAFEDGRWSRRYLPERVAVLGRLADLIEEHADELARLETAQTGSAYKLRRDSDLPFTVDNLRVFAGAVRHLEGRAAYEYSGSHTSFVRREPLGVVGQVSPWNYPLWMAIWKIGPALAAGNSVVLKPASATPLTTIRLAELAAEAASRPAS